MRFPIKWPLRDRLIETSQPIPGYRSPTADLIGKASARTALPTLFEHPKLEAKLAFGKVIWITPIALGALVGRHRCMVVEGLKKPAPP